MATSVIDQLRTYATAYNVVSYQIETELLRVRQRLMDEELDRQIREAEGLLSNYRPNVIDTMQQIEDMLIYGETIQHVGQNPDREITIERVDPRTTIARGERPNNVIMEEAGNMSYSFETLDFGRGWENQVSSNSNTMGTTLTEQDVRDYMEVLATRTNNSPSYVMYTGTGGMQHFQDAMRSTITNSYGLYTETPTPSTQQYQYTASTRQWTSGSITTERNVYFGTDIIDLMDTYTSYKGNLIEITEKDSSTLKINVKNMTLLVPNSNGSIYREALIQAKMEKFVGVNGFNWIQL